MLLHVFLVTPPGAFTERAALLEKELRAACLEAEAAVKRDFETLLQPQVRPPKTLQTKLQQSPQNKTQQESKLKKRVDRQTRL